MANFVGLLPDRIQMVTPNGELINQRVKRNDRNEITENEIDIRLTDNSNYRSTLRRNHLNANTIVVKVSTENTTSSLKIIIDQLTSKVYKIDKLVFDHSVKSTIIQV